MRRANRAPATSVAPACARRPLHGSTRRPWFRLRRTLHRERGERIVGSQYPRSKRNIGTML
ncbi:hypothetical protein DID96_26170 [Burkholderia sp. Bp8963]|nr:hypothetical protein DID96_26170 [Burkholderia sp. Bp8963]